MKFERSSGILLHPTSLPGKYGIGDLGKEAYNFINFLKASGHNLWQVLPLGPTGYGDSPYQCFSAFAGNTNLISPQLLIEDGLLTSNDAVEAPNSNPHKIDYGAVIGFKDRLLRKAYSNFKSNGNNFDEECGAFCKENEYWLDDYALFMAVKQKFGMQVWTAWDEDIAFRKGNAVEEWKKKLTYEIEYRKFIQYLFAKQWRDVKKYANENDIKIIGDIPIFIAFDSADLWANKELFTVNDEGRLDKVAGVPPDYFSATGQLWGNPLYKWDLMENDDFEWWKKRFKKTLDLVDIIRIDHFRGFEAYYEIPGDAPTAETGKWKRGPGEKLFNSIKKEFGKLPIIAENLGVITKAVEDLRKQFDFPGMYIMQFAFGEEGEKRFLPHNFEHNSVVYSGSHDNDTTRAFFEKEKETDSGIYEWAQQYLNYYGENIGREIIRSAYASVADIALFPMQDVLNLGGDARMNFPSKPSGNWTWRFTWDQVSDEIANDYKQMGYFYDRPKQLGKYLDDIEMEEK